MRIDSIEIIHLSLPLVHYFETSFGRDVERHVILVSMEAGGEKGWGEAAALQGPWYNSETIASSWLMLKDFMIPLILGKEFESPEDFALALQPIRGNHFSRTSLEEAFLDCYTRLTRIPLHRYLGGVSTEIPVGVSLGIQDSTAELFSRVETFLEQGYCRIKLKIKPGWDVTMLMELRKRFPQVPFMVDGNQAYSVDSHLSLFQEMDGFGLMMIEQPLAWDDLEGHARLAGAIKTPICLDESIVSLNTAKLAISLQACSIINIKPGRVGGILAAKGIHDLCASRGIANWCGGMLETGIGRCHNLCLSSLPNFTLPGDLSASSRYYEEDVIDPPVSLGRDGKVRLSDEAGIGVRVRENFIAQCTRNRKAFS